MNAKNNHLPVYIFVDKKVEAEYRTYLQNKESTIKYAYVDSPNVYKFIEKIYNNNDYVYTFENFDDIKKQLIEQWAGLMFLYLRALKEEKQLDCLSNEIENLKNISSRIDIAIGTILKNTSDAKDVQAVNKRQSDVLIKSSAMRFASKLPYFETNTTKEQINQFVNKLLAFFEIDDFTNKYTTQKASLFVKELYLSIFNQATEDFDRIKIRKLYQIYNEEKQKLDKTDKLSFEKYVCEEVANNNILPF